MEITKEDLQEYLNLSQIGFWKLEMQRGLPTKMYVDFNMQALIGVPDGLSPEECYAFFENRIHLEDRNLIKEYAVDIMSGDATVEYFYNHPTKGKICIRCNGRRIKKQGNCIIIMGHDQEMSDVICLKRGQLEENQLQRYNRQLKQQQIRTDDYYKSLLDMVNCGVLAYTIPGHKILHMNLEALRIYGVKNLNEAQNSMGEMLTNVIYPNKTIPKRLRRLHFENDVVDYECTVSNRLGQTIHILAKTEVFLTPQYERCVVTTFLDISESLTLKNALEDSRRKNNIIGAVTKLYWQVFSVNLQTDIYKEVFTDGKFTMDDPNFIGLAHKDFVSAVKRFVDEAYEDRMVKFLNHSTLPERLFEADTVSIEYQSKYGFWVLARYVAQTRDENGNVTEVLFILEQIDGQKRKELEYKKKLEQTAKEARRANEAKTNFLRRMSHDIRTPLNGIMGLLKINEVHYNDLELVQENNEKMKASANHLLSLINDVLQMSKLEDGNTVLTHEFINLSDLTKDIVNIIVIRAVEAGIEWEYEKGKSKIPYPYIYGSPLHLRQIFLNIYGNCIKYNRPGGKISTSVDALPEQDGIGAYHWMIKDTGIGMSEEFLEHIFEPFAQEKNDTEGRGIGLGMAIVKGLIDQMGGTISITSKEGVGSTFEITIPFEIAFAPEEEVKKVEGLKGNIKGLHLMLVEDNELNVEIAQMLLEDEGARVSVVRNGEQAVELFKKNPPETFDAILMDMMMPVMDGLTATKTIRGLKRLDAKTIPIIAMTANAFKEDGQKCLEAGMNAHLSKPLEMEKVVETIACFCKSFKVE